MPPLLQVRDLVKHFRGVAAVDGVSFTVAPGVCLGLLGPNGAGKTTTVEMLEGIKRPTSGEILYKGKPLGRQFRNEAGIMFQSTAIQEFITAREALHLFASLYPRSTAVPQLVASCSLEGFLDRDTRKLSGGQRQRLLLAIALVNDPDIVFLDEPTTGLDPKARHAFWELVNGIKSKGKTVILTTHYMEEAYKLCDEIAILDRGRIIAQGNPKKLLAEHYREVVLQLPAAEVTGQDLGKLRVVRLSDTVQIPTADVNAAIRHLLARGVSLAHLEIRPRTLDDLFLELTGRELQP